MTTVVNMTAGLLIFSTSTVSAEPSISIQAFWERRAGLFLAGKFGLFTRDMRLPATQEIIANSQCCHLRRFGYRFVRIRSRWKSFLSIRSEGLHTRLEHTIRESLI